MVKVYSKGLDEQGRLAAWVFVGGQCLNARQIEAGLAWWDRARAPGEKKLEALRNAALEARRGLWSEIAPTAPWEWLEEQKQVPAVAGAATSGEPQDEMAVLPPAPQRAIVPEAALLDLPDMVITKVEFRPAVPKVGESIQPILYYKNIGTAPADGVLVSYAKNELDGGGTHTHAVAAGEQISWLMGGLRATKAGEFKLEFALDPENKIKELDEKNNTLTVVLRVKE